MMKIKASNKRQRVKSYQSVEAIHIKNDVATPVRCSVGRCHCKDIRMGQRASSNDNHDYNMFHGSTIPRSPTTKAW